MFGFMRPCHSCACVRVRTAPISPLSDFRVFCVCMFLFCIFCFCFCVCVFVHVLLVHRKELVHRHIIVPLTPSLLEKLMIIGPDNTL